MSDPVLDADRHERLAVPPTRPPEAPGNPIAAARGRQILFYAADGVLGGTLTCSRCGATGRQPDVIEHTHDCSYRRLDRDGAAR